MRDPEGDHEKPGENRRVSSRDKDTGPGERPTESKRENIRNQQKLDPSLDPAPTLLPCQQQ